MANEFSMVIGDTPPMSGLMAFTTDRLAAEESAKMSRSQQGDLARMAEVTSLRADVVRLRDERDKLLETQQRVLELIGSSDPKRLLHDLRNVLNERALFRALAETVM
jgi:hypothetical protein